MNVPVRRALIAVARGQAHADLYVRGATLLNVYTGELYPANVAVRGDRIAYVGLRDDMVGPRTSVLETPGHVLVPGYIDPHVHPAHLITPSALARHPAMGTTTVFADTPQIWELGGLKAFRVVADAGPGKFYWMMRVRPVADDRRGPPPLRDPRPWRTRRRGRRGHAGPTCTMAPPTRAPRPTQ
jgi:adenine deaminase